METKTRTSITREKKTTNNLRLDNIFYYRGSDWEEEKNDNRPRNGYKSVL